MKKLYKVNQISWESVTTASLGKKHITEYFGFRWVAEMFCDMNRLDYGLIEEVKPTIPPGWVNGLFPTGISFN